MFPRDTLAIQPPVIRMAPTKRIYWRHCDNTMAAKLNNPGWNGYSVVSGPWWKDSKYWGL